MELDRITNLSHLIRMCRDLQNEGGKLGVRRSVCGVDGLASLVACADDCDHRLRRLKLPTLQEHSRPRIQGIDKGERVQALLHRDS